MGKPLNDEEQAARLRVELGQYLEPRGLDLDDFAAQIRDYFKSSLEHHDRLVYRNALAGCLNLDMAREKDRDTLWKTVAGQHEIARKVRGQWLTGEIDPPRELLKQSLLQLVCPGVESQLAALFDLAAPVRMGIARTLTYIQVFPSRESVNVDLLNKHASAELRKCWAMLRRHVYYRTPAKKPRRNLNQHALDCVREMFGTLFWIEPNKLGDVMQSVEADRTGEHPLFWHYFMFKFATFADIASTNRAKGNPYRWIWDDGHPRFNEIWGIN